MSKIQQIRQICKRNIGNRRFQQIQRPFYPVQLSYASYEDTKTRELKEVFQSPPVLIMHGLFGSKGNFNSISKSLQQRTQPGRKIIAIDSRNHGDSNHSNIHTYETMALDVKLLLEKLKIPKISFIGHSEGGRVGMFLSLIYPELIEKLIIVDISPVGRCSIHSKLIKCFGAMAGVKLPLTLSLNQARRSVDAALMRHISEKKFRAFLLTNLVQNSNGFITWRLNLSALRNNYANLVRFPIDIDSGASFLGPTLFINGGLSDNIKSNDHTNIKRLFPNAVFKTISNAGHWVHLDNTTEFVNLCLEMLNNKNVSNNDNKNVSSIKIIKR